MAKTTTTPIYDSTSKLAADLIGVFDITDLLDICPFNYKLQLEILHKANDFFQNGGRVTDIRSLSNVGNNFIDAVSLGRENSALLAAAELLKEKLEIYIADCRKIITTNKIITDEDNGVIDHFRAIFQFYAQIIREDIINNINNKQATINKLIIENINGDILYRDAINKLLEVQLLIKDIIKLENINNPSHVSLINTLYKTQYDVIHYIKDCATAAETSSAKAIFEDEQFKPRINQFNEVISDLLPQLTQIISPLLVQKITTKQESIKKLLQQNNITDALTLEQQIKNSIDILLPTGNKQNNSSIKQIIAIQDTILCLFNGADLERDNKIDQLHNKITNSLNALTIATISKAQIEQVSNKQQLIKQIFSYSNTQLLSEQYYGLEFHKQTDTKNINIIEEYNQKHNYYQTKAAKHMSSNIQNSINVTNHIPNTDTRDHLLVDYNILSSDELEYLDYEVSNILHNCLYYSRQSAPGIKAIFKFARILYPKPGQGVEEVGKVGYEKIIDLMRYFPRLQPLLIQKLITFKDFSYISINEMQSFFDGIRVNNLIGSKLSFSELLIVTQSMQSLDKYLKTSKITITEQDSLALFKAILEGDDKQLNIYREQGLTLSENRIELLLFTHRYNYSNFSLIYCIEFLPARILEEGFKNNILYEILCRSVTTYDKETVISLIYKCLPNPIFNITNELIPPSYQKLDLAISQLLIQAWQILPAKIFNLSYLLNIVSDDLILKEIILEQVMEKVLLGELNLQELTLVFKHCVPSLYSVIFEGKLIDGLSPLSNNISKKIINIFAERPTWFNAKGLVSCIHTNNIGNHFQPSYLLEILKNNFSLGQFTEIIAIRPELKLFHALIIKDNIELNKWWNNGIQIIGEQCEKIFEYYYHAQTVQLTPEVARFFSINSPIFNFVELKKDFVHNLLYFKYGPYSLAYNIVQHGNLEFFKFRNIKLCYPLTELLLNYYIQDETSLDLVDFIKFILSFNFILRSTNEPFLVKLLDVIKNIPNKLELLETIFSKSNYHLLSVFSLSNIIDLSKNDLQVISAFLRLEKIFLSWSDVVIALSKNPDCAQILVETKRIATSNALKAAKQQAFKLLLSLDKLDEIKSFLNYDNIEINGVNRVDAYAPLNIIIGKIIIEKHTEYIEILKLLLKKPFLLTDIISSRKPLSVLNEVISENHNEIAKLLLNHHNTLINNPNSTYHPLGVAIKTKNYSLIEAILHNSKFNINLTNYNGEFIFNKLLNEINDLQVKKTIIKVICSSAHRDFNPEIMYSVINFAIKLEEHDISLTEEKMIILLSHAAVNYNINDHSHDAYGRTLLFNLVKNNNNLSLIKACLKYGADITITDIFNMSILEQALINNRLDILKLIIDHSQNYHIDIHDLQLKVARIAITKNPHWQELGMLTDLWETLNLTPHEIDQLNTQIHLEIHHVKDAASFDYSWVNTISYIAENNIIYCLDDGFDPPLFYECNQDFGENTSKDISVTGNSLHSP